MCVNRMRIVSHQSGPPPAARLGFSFVSFSFTTAGGLTEFFSHSKKKVGFICIIFVLFLKKNEKKGVDLHTVEATGGHGYVYSWSGPGGGGWLICITLRIR